MIKANASSVVSNLGGGDHGHLGLNLSSSTYNNITGITNIKPKNPGELIIDDNTPLRKALILREHHNEKLHLFRKMVAIKAALKTQIISAIKPFYLVD